MEAYNSVNSTEPDLENSIELSDVKIDKIRDHTVAGELVNRFLQKWSNTVNKQPRWRGNVFCFGYFGESTEPWFTIGPDFKFSIGELLLFNCIICLGIKQSDGIVLSISIISLML